jgi:putative SOS response-associated peptidase YedK
LSGPLSTAAFSRWPGFYDPHKFENGRKEPFYVHLVDRPLFGVAGLWGPRKSADGTVTFSCTLILTPPNHLMARIHNEKLAMPTVLHEQDHETWLTGSQADARAVLNNLYPSDLMVAWQMSRRLYANKTPDDAGLIEPVPEPT